MDKRKILKAAQPANDEGKRHIILRDQSIIFGMYTLGLVFLFVVRLLHAAPTTELLFLVLMGGLGIEISEVLEKRSVISILTSLFLIILIIYAAFLVINGR